MLEGRIRSHVSEDIFRHRGKDNTSDGEGAWIRHEGDSLRKETGEGRNR